MAFIDGENLTARFEAMVKEGRQPRITPRPGTDIATVVHSQSNYVWSSATLRSTVHRETVKRVHYYTTFTGTINDMQSFEEIITRLGCHTHPVPLPLVPRVFLKAKSDTPCKSVDINICVDVLEYVRQEALDAVYLVTGDADYMPLVEAVMRAGKIVYVGALSSGLSRRLQYQADRFDLLDEIYFEG